MFSFENIVTCFLLYEIERSAQHNKVLEEYYEV